MNTVNNHYNDSSSHQKNILQILQTPECFGRMNDFTASSYIKGPCGDSMEFYLLIKDNIIKDVKFYTDGCISTIACGSVTARLTLGKSIEEALGISAKRVFDELHEYPGITCHCSILAVSTLYKAIASFLLDAREHNVV